MRYTWLLRRIGLAMMVSVFFIGSAEAQVTPAASSTPPDDTPVIRVGMTLFPNYSVQNEPTITDADGNAVKRSAFDVARAYINITGNVSHIVAFRVTPDITRETGLFNSATGGNVTSDSLVYRIKYAYAQFNLDDWMTRGSWARIGIQQTPWVDFEEGIYRYRFQGTVFAERIPLTTAMTSSDAGASFHYNFGKNFGDIHVGVYNGENYQKTETNSQKAVEFRGTLRPFPSGKPVFRGFRAHLVYYDDQYVKDGDRRRVMGNFTYEHQYVNLGYDYLSAKDQQLRAAPEVNSNGYSFWATPKKPMANGSSIEALLRYDHFIPNNSDALSNSNAPDPTVTFKSQEQNRSIFGVAYWFAHTGNVSTALMLDYDAQSFQNLTTKPTKIVFIHGLVNF